MMVGTGSTSGLAAQVIALVLYLVIGAGQVAAQTTTARISGRVTGDAGEPLAAANVTARSLDTNLERSALTSEAGTYTLPGLPPDAYEITVEFVGRSPQTRQVRAQIGQSLTVNFSLATTAIALEEITVQGAAVTETRTPEVATNVTQEQIENIPLNNRNFLSLARLAPGVKAVGAGGITSGALPADNINVFIDGATYKNDILRGGMAGQDASLGNPFPQNAVQEFRVITQQYKAEYQKATSAIITATTKSGTNEWHGDAFAVLQNDDLVQQDFFALERCETAKANGDSCAPKPSLDFYQLGGSLGGPIVRDKLFFFGSYEGNVQDRVNSVTFGSQAANIPQDIIDSLEPSTGDFTAPFRSHLALAKLTYTPTPSSPHRFELIGNARFEDDIRDFGGVNAYESGTHFSNDTYTLSGKHQYASGNWLNEAIVTAQRYRWNPSPESHEIGIEYRDALKIGGRCCGQDRIQDRLAFRNDVTYTLSDWAGDHVFKAGVTLDFLRYDLTFFRSATPQFIFIAPEYDFPTEANYGQGDARSVTHNQQFGIYLQDDWAVTPRLTLNLGVRWDYESNMMNNGFVTPDSAVQSLNSYAATLPCGDASAPDYRKLLCDPDRYISTGDNRDAFMGAIQPRLGFSYDLTGGNRTVLFGGFGIYYDRVTQADVYDEPYRHDWAVYTFRFSEDGAPLPNGTPTIQWDDRYLSEAGLQEILASGSAPKPELWLLDNEQEPPKSYQGSIGVRQRFGDVSSVSANYTGVRGHNFITWLFGNRNENGSCCEQLDKFSNVLVSTADTRSSYDALYISAEKRYTEDSPWGAQIAYTLAKSEIEAEGLITGYAASPEEFQRIPAPSDERHHFTGNWIIGLPLDARFSGIIDLGSAKPINLHYGGDSCTTGNLDCISNEYPEGETRNSGREEEFSFILPDFWAFRNVDLRLAKDFVVRGMHRIGVTAAVFNVFNFDNFECYDARLGDLDADGNVVVEDPAFGPGNPEAGQPSCVITNALRTGTPRRFQLGMEYHF